MAKNIGTLSVSFASLAVLDQRCRLQLNELERIQNKLEKWLRPKQARETADQIHGRVLEVDEELDRILADPLVRRSYEYDGRFFTPKHSWGFYRAFDGLHILKSLTDDLIETFFRGSEKEAVQWLMDELGKDTWLAKRRRMNWEESKTLSLIPKPVLDEIVKQIRQHSGTAVEPHVPLSVEEESFFRSFEKQMENPT